MATIDEDLLAAAILAGLHLERTSVETIPGGKSGSRVFRIMDTARQPLILKILNPLDQPEHLVLNYPHLAETEYRFYTELAPKLELPGPQVFAAGRLSHGGSFLLMDDLTLTHHIPAENHRWSEVELRSILAAYTRLHSRSIQVFAREGVPTWLNPDPRTEYSSSRVIECLEAFAANDWTRALVDPILRSAHLDALVQKVKKSLDHLPAGLLYNDFYPCNVAIPHSPGPAVIFDWQLAGSGPLAIDMVNIGLLGQSDAFTQIDVDPLLGFYLDQLGEAMGERPDTRLFREQCHWATLLAWGVFMPRMVRAMQHANQQGHQFSKWMGDLYKTCMSEWAKALKNG